MRYGIAVLVLLLLVAGCGGGDKASAPVASPTPAPSVATAGAPGEAELVAAVRAYGEACLEGRARAAWRLLSSDVQDRMTFAQYRAVVAAIAAQYGDAKLVSVKVVALDGDMARVTYRFTDPAVDQTDEPWRVEDGAWRYDD